MGGGDFHNHPEMEPDPELVKPLLHTAFNISNRDFKRNMDYVWFMER